MNENYEIARAFWDREQYPHYGVDIKARRLQELNLLLPKLPKKGRLLDIGCGDGGFLNCLRELTDLELIGCDWSEKMLANLHHDIRRFVYDCRSGEQLPESDVAVLGGVLGYIFEDEDVIKLLKAIPAPKLYVRITCNTVDITTANYHEELGEPYASRYRTVPQIVSLLATKYAKVGYERVYPEHLESKHGTRQWYFTCEV